MSTIHLVVGPPGADRLARLVAAYRGVTGFGAALFLTRTRRLADEIRPRLATGVLPQAFDLQSFADELVRTHLPAVRPLSDTERRLLLDDVLSELRDGREMPYFAAVADTRGFASGAGGYVAELKAAGVDLRALLKASRGGPRHEQAAKLFDRYQRRLAKRHRFDPVDRLGRAAELWAAGKREPFGRVRAVFAAGFRTLAPFERKLLDALRESAEHVWIELPEGGGEAFAGPRALRAWASAAEGGASLFDPEAEVVEVPGRTRGVSDGVGADTPTPSLTPRVRLLEAPGDLGEARLVARHVRTLLADGTPPDRVLVVARQFAPPALELFREVFDEYGVPHEAEGADPLGRVPAVAFLLRAVRLPDDDWPFAPLAAVLRSSYFRPAWPEVQADPEVPAKAEALLRMLGEPRGREAYLDAVRAWEHAPPERLEDELLGEPERRKQALAARCRPFLERFFKAWDRLKPGGTAEASVARLKAFADDIGLSPAATCDDGDRDGLARFWRELDRWARGEGADARKPLRPERFARVLASVAAVPCRGRSARDPGRVRLLSAENAVGLECDHLFLVGLGEGSWPRLTATESLLDDGERDRLRNAGFELPDPSARLGAEQLLFAELVAAPRCGLVLSYAAVDEQGQPLLPSSFLRELLAGERGVSVARQRMLLDGYFTQEPMSEAELRVQYARRAGGVSPPSDDNAQLTDDLLDNLARAHAVAHARFRAHSFGPFDGQLRHTAVTAELAKRFGAERVFSPTALETFVACPFRFWLQHVLKLEPLEDPAEEVEHTRRGAAFHRALARFHRWVNENVAQTLADAELPEAMTDELQRHVLKAVGEYAARAPSRAGRELWLLEGRRLARAAARYRGHWHEFRKPWREKNATPAPFALEADFGMPGENVPEPLLIAAGGIEVRIGGRIDRVDVAEAGGETGFWVIDYKTGRATNYSAAQVEKFEKLQLPLYALAVERVLLKDRPARPLGLAYWLVTDTGHKPMLPSGKRAVLSWLADPARWHRFREQLEAWVATLVTHIRGGDFPLAPRSEHCTDTCPFGPVCRIAQSRNTGKVFPLALPVLKE